MQANARCPGSPRAGTILLTVREVDPATWNARQMRPNGLQLALKRGWDGYAASEGPTEVKRKNRSGSGVPFGRDPGTLPRERGAGLPPHPTPAAGSPDEPGAAIKKEEVKEMPPEHNHYPGCDPDDLRPDGNEAHGRGIAADRAALALLDLRYGWLVRRVSLGAGDGSHDEPIAEPESANERRFLAPVLPKTDNLPRGMSPELVRYAVVSSRAAIAGSSSSTTLKSSLKSRGNGCGSTEGGCCKVSAGSGKASSSGAAEADGSSSGAVPKQLTVEALLCGIFYKLWKDAANTMTREEKVERLEGIIKKLWLKKGVHIGQ